MQRRISFKEAGELAVKALLAAEEKRLACYKAEADFYARLEATQVDLAPEFAAVIEENFWELL